MLYVIRKVPERNTEYLERLLPGALVVNDNNHRGAIWSMCEAFRAARDDAVYVQDDMILCRDFQRRAESYIAMHSGDVVVFSNFNHDSTESDVRDEGYHRIRTVQWLLCTYIPLRLSSLFLRQWDSGMIPVGKRDAAADLDDNVFSKWLDSVGEDGFLTVPNLAGHPANDSSIASRPPRLCWNFDYEDCEPGSPDHDRTLAYYRRHRHEWIGPNGEALHG